MLLKLLKDKKTGSTSVAVQQGDRWLPLLPLWRYAAAQEGYRGLSEAALTDMVAFLSDWKASVKEARRLLGCLGKVPISDGDYTGGLLPFKPLSHRDFMLYEQHVIDATRAFLKRYRPEVYENAEKYEKDTGTVHAALKPKPIWYEKPIFYMGNHLSFYPDNSEILWPAYSRMMDYELELGMLITKPLFNATPEEAREAIGGFTVFNDCSARDVQLSEMESGFGPMKAKNFANVVSEVVATPDEIWPYFDTIGVRVYLNGALAGTGKIGSLYHRPETAVAYASSGEHIYPGEFMASGTISGCSGIESDHLLKSGDVLRMEIDRIGALTTRIRTEQGVEPIL
jgi:2-keto-4-pentenoate hydratase/2-oxohepta-3-ene-1,7-dioic acid hydratase in catechol pathway